MGKKHNARTAIVIGEPCVGKSTIMKLVLAGEGWDYSTQRKFLPMHIHKPSKAVVLGRYDEPEHQFPGTDRMSMAAQPHAIDFARDTMQPLLFEGSRLGTVSMIDACRSMGRDVRVFVVFSTPKTLAARRDRERTQPARFIQAQRTRINNIIEFLPEDSVRMLRNNNMADAKENATLLRRWVGIE